MVFVRITIGRRWYFCNVSQRGDCFVPGRVWDVRKSIDKDSLITRSGRS